MDPPKSPMVYTLIFVAGLSLGNILSSPYFWTGDKLQEKNTSDNNIIYHPYTTKNENAPSPVDGVTISERSVSSNSSDEMLGCIGMKGVGVPTFKTRGELGAIVQSEGFTRGIELGVQRGYFTRAMLSNWLDCSEYHLVDLWGHQENYSDVANLNQNEQEKIYGVAMKTVNPWKEKIHVCRNYTINCVNNYADEHFDFIYVDARHDYKGVWEDIVAYWPKLRVGGVMAGHDYVTQNDGPEQTGQDWTLNYDGTKDHTSRVVKGAVDDFAATVCRQVTVSYREKLWNTWAIRK